MFILDHLNGFGATAAAATATAGAGDPYWANVVLLLQPTASDTAIVDHGPLGKTLTVAGNTALSPTVPWTGVKSIAFDGSGDYVYAADSTDWYFPGDFTIDIGYYDTAATGSMLAGQLNVSNDASWGLWSYFTSYSPEFLYSTTGSTSSRLAAANNGNNSWQHLSVQRSGTTLSFYQQFALAASTTLSAALFDSASPLSVGSDSRLGPNPFSGYIAYLRITKGVARYSGASITTLTGALPA